MNIRATLVAVAASLSTTLAAYTAGATCISAQSTLSHVQSEWLALGGTTSVLGLPLNQSNQAGINDWFLWSEPNGFAQNFQSGVYWVDVCNGGYIGGEVHGLIKSKYDALGDAGSFLGYPTTNEENTPTSGSDGGRVNFFEGGRTDGGAGAAIYWSSPSGAHEMHGMIFSQFSTYGTSTSGLGYPTSDEQSCSFCGGGGRENVMQNGFMAFHSSPSNAAWGIFTVPHTTSHLEVQAVVHPQFEDATVTLYWSGFQANEPVSFYANAPSGQTFLATKNADGSGNVTYLAGNFGWSGGGGIGGTGLWSSNLIMTFEARSSSTGSIIASGVID